MPFESYRDKLKREERNRKARVAAAKAARAADDKLINKRNMVRNADGTATGFGDTASRGGPWSYGGARRSKARRSKAHRSKARRSRQRRNRSRAHKSRRRR